MGDSATTGVEAEIGSTAGIDVAVGIYCCIFFSFLYRGRKIGLRSTGFEPGSRTFVI